MACSNPNLIEHDARYKGIKFLGRPQYLVELIDDPHWIGLDEGVQELFYVPCGNCLDCRISRRYERAVRIMLEASCYGSRNVFITLTYNDEHVGWNDLEENHFVQFQKDFRRVYGQAQYCDVAKRHWKKNVRSYTHKSFKFIQTGEYGDQFGRKHYHSIIFNHSFEDMYFTGFYSKKGNPIFSSPSLEALWGKGNVQCESLTFDLALYVGKYITDGWEDDSSVDSVTGLCRKSAYSTSSHGIGLTWLKKYYRDVLGAGKVMLHDRDCPIPRYFKKKMAELWPVEYARWRRKNFIALKKKMKFIRDNSGDGLLASAVRSGQLTSLKHKQKETLCGIPRERI